MRTTPRPVGLVCAPAAFGGAQRYALSLLAHTDAVLLALEPLDPTLAALAAATGRPVVAVPDGDALPAAAAAAGVGALHVNATDPVAEADLVRTALATGLPVTATVHMTDTYARAPRPADAAQLWAGLRGVVAPSRAIAAHLREAHGVPAHLVHHVPNGVAERPARDLPPVAGRPLRVGCLARLTRQKGLDVLVAAVGQVEDERPGALEVVVAGEGREAGALAAASAGLPITWAGHADDPDALLGSVDAYVQPSREDALPLALLEAAMTGLPCVAARVGDVPDLLGGAVLLVEPEDAAGLAAALLRLADDDQLRAVLAARARATAVARHTDEAMAAATADVLRAAWGRPAREPAA